MESFVLLSRPPIVMSLIQGFDSYIKGHGGAVVLHSPPTSEVSGSNPGPDVGKLVVAFR